ncbi:MAG: hypothetical protein J07AB43_02030 [Candidatus Nanosalina sp. J07AB43]|nr:MAG: hypothetical protein J07AB43_02030 [Candidatus Nanosalina sp. J07AB43]
MTNSSCRFGPFQVRDLSEHWSQAELKIAKPDPNMTLNSYRSELGPKSKATMRCTELTELPLSQNSRRESCLWASIDEALCQIKEVTRKFYKQKPVVNRVGALGQSVRGSIPSSVIWSMTTAPFYKTSESSGQTQLLYKSTVVNSN